MGVTGGEPYGFDVGATGTTKALKGLDYGVRGMRKGGLRKLIVPPELGYGEKGADALDRRLLGVRCPVRSRRRAWQTAMCAGSRAKYCKPRECAGKQYTNVKQQMCDRAAAR